MYIMHAQWDDLVLDKLSKYLLLLMVNAMTVIHVIYFINALPVISYSRVLVQMTKELPASFSISYLFFSDIKSHHWGTGSKLFKATY